MGFHIGSKSSFTPPTAPESVTPSLISGKKIKILKTGLAWKWDIRQSLEGCRCRFGKVPTGQTDSLVSQIQTDPSLDHQLTTFKVKTEDLHKVKTLIEMQWLAIRVATTSPPIRLPLAALTNPDGLTRLSHAFPEASRLAPWAVSLLHYRDGNRRPHLGFLVHPDEP